MALEALHEEAKPLGLEVSWLKTKVQVFEGLVDEIVHACGEDIEISESFTYLGSAVQNDGGSRQEVLRRIGIAHGVMALARCLHKSGGALQYTPVKCARIMIGCIFLHNRCVLRGIPLPQEQLEAEDNEDIGDVYVPVDADLESGRIVREELRRTSFP
ncbi:putative nuclease HARBI1 [Chionoecetes opilio]|uniref:Putative nuclease HARBI1 n=1 Tax=Chionoecetes opilio TaxID=41210 RepID=A0A8J5CDA4_CHIOP|nr:putative nuclease HARBI1 [Chionoecetes opilio]